MRRTGADTDPASVRSRRAAPHTENPESPGSDMSRLAVGLWWGWAIGIHALALWALLEAGFRF